MKELLRGVAFVASTYRDASPQRAKLSPENMKRARCAMNAPASDVISSGFKVDVCGRDMATLQPGRWLNDEVINFYLQLLRQRAARWREQDPSAPRVHCFNTFFYAKLTERGYRYAAVKRWTRRAKVCARIHACAVCGGEGVGM